MPSEYGLSELAHEIPTELTRLRALERAVDPFSTQCLELAGSDGQMRCLEIGAGTGTIADWLAKRHARSAVVATELDLRFLTVSDNVRVVEHDIRTEGFPDGSFDLIHARAVLSHISQREAILARAWHWLAPDGVLCIEDPDITIGECSGYHELAAALRGLHAALARSLGTDLRWARNLPRLLHQAGYESIDMRALPLIVGNGSPAEDLIRASFLQLRAALAAADPDLAAIVDIALRRFTEPDFTDLAGLFIAAWGRRPRGEPA